MDAMLRRLTRRAARRRMVDTAERLRLDVEQLRAEVQLLRSAGGQDTAAAIDELKAEIDECRRDNLRIAELYDLTMERLGAPTGA
jgi:hypothetical protein